MGPTNDLTPKSHLPTRKLPSTTCDRNRRSSYPGSRSLPVLIILRLVRKSSNLQDQCRWFPSDERPKHGHFGCGGLRGHAALNGYGVDFADDGIESQGAGTLEVWDKSNAVGFAFGVDHGSTCFRLMGGR